MIKDFLGTWNFRFVYFCIEYKCISVCVY